jgi:hypothetical protein
MSHALHRLRQLGALPLRVSLAAGGLAAAIALGWWLGAGRVQARWDAAELAHARAAADARAENELLRASAAAAHEAARQQIQSRTPEARRAVNTALRQPVPCPPPAPGAPPAADLALGDVRVPAAVVDGLRRAGAPPAAP